MQASATAEDDAAVAQNLALQAKMMATINRLQTTDTSGRPGGSSAVPAHVPPPMPPQLFACPDRQQVVPGVRPPEARSDLVDIMRCVNDHIAAALGVPASVIFEGKFSSNSMSQLQLLNGTIQSIAIAVNKVLTATYHAVYDDAKEGDELTLLTAPLCSTAELQSLFEAGVIDIESALPAALHSLGAHGRRDRGGRPSGASSPIKSGTDTKLLEAQNQRQAGRRRRAAEGGADGQDARPRPRWSSSRWPRPRPRPRRRSHDAGCAARHAGGRGQPEAEGGSGERQQVVVVVVC